VNQKQTARVRLRKFGVEDIARKMAWVHDPRINQRLHHQLPLTEDKIRSWLDCMEAEDRHDLIVETDAGEAIGSIGLEQVNRQHRQAEFYITIGEPRYFGFSGSQATRLLLDYAFLQLGLNKVWTKTETTNTAAIVLCTRLKFQFEGILRQEYIGQGPPRDAVRLSLLASEYLSLQGLTPTLAIESAPMPAAALEDAGVDPQLLYQQVIIDLVHSNDDRPAMQLRRGESLMSADSSLSKSAAALLPQLQIHLAEKWSGDLPPAPLHKEDLCTQLAIAAIDYHLLHIQPPAGATIEEPEIWTQSFPRLALVLRTLAQADRQRRGGTCGHVPLQLDSAASWLELLHCLRTFARHFLAQERQDEPDYLLQRLDLLCLTVAAGDRLAPLTPALWQAVYNALSNSLATVKILPPAPLTLLLPLLQPDRSNLI
jgi:diamine N-acetyltransferase